ncbi:MAG TPA: hypothetical protein VF719_10010 [Abditibacteriaceae bacterium]|jgi:hypothetical protein
MTPFYRRPIRLKTVLIVLLTPLMLAGVPALLWLAWNARPVNVTREYGITTPAVPSPNAYDIYKQSYDTFRSPRPGRAPSLLLDYQAAPGSVDDKKKYPLAGKIAWVKHNEKAYALFDKALKTPYLLPPVRSAQPGGELSGPFFLRYLARNITVECEALAEQGQHERAVNRALDIWKMGLDAGHGAYLVAALQAMAVEGIARRALDGEIAHLNAKEAARAARRWEKIAATRVAYKDVLLEERNSFLFQIKPGMENAIRDIRRSKEIEAAVERGETNFHSDSGPAPEINSPVLYWAVRKKANSFVSGIEPLLKNSEAPWTKRQITLPPGLEPTMASMVDVLGKSRFNFARMEAFSQITLARLGLHAYRKDKGVYPPTLDALVPAYLTKAPFDPFTENQTLRYARQGRRYKLWSVGPDARDDGGRPVMDAAAKTAKARYMVTAEATGDIVANISR